MSQSHFHFTSGISIKAPKSYEVCRRHGYLSSVAVIPFSIVPMTSLLPRGAIGYAEKMKIDFLTAYAAAAATFLSKEDGVTIPRRREGAGQVRLRLHSLILPPPHFSKESSRVGGI